MSTFSRVAVFVGGLAAVFGLAFAGGRTIGPDEAPVAATHGHDADGSGHTSHEAAAVDLPGGLAASADGYTLDLTTERTESPGRRPLGFSITGPDGLPVTAYDSLHERQLHLIVVRRDLTGFQHLHPLLDNAGQWRTDADLTPGSWRLIADFQPAGAERVTLGTDVEVAGDYRPRTLGGETRRARVDGFEVTLDGDLTPGESGLLTLSVSKGGRPVADLQPYLGAFGHLVMLRQGDLAYVHVHPEDGEPGPELAFHAETPSDGAYRLFLDFKHGGVVHTAIFTVNAGGAHDDD